MAKKKTKRRGSSSAPAEVTRATIQPTSPNASFVVEPGGSILLRGVWRLAPAQLKSARIRFDLTK